MKIDDFKADDQDTIEEKTKQNQAFPPVEGRYPGEVVRAGYLPPMKQASGFGRRGDERDAAKRDYKLRSYCWLAVGGNWLV